MCDKHAAWVLSDREFRSRLIIGTGKYKSYAENAAALKASGAEIVTVAVRRVNVSDPTKERLTDHIDPRKVTCPTPLAASLRTRRCVL